MGCIMCCVGLPFNRIHICFDIMSTAVPPLRLKRVYKAVATVYCAVTDRYRTIAPYCESRQRKPRAELYKMT